MSKNVKPTSIQLKSKPKTEPNAARKTPGAVGPVKTGTKSKSTKILDEKKSETKAATTSQSPVPVPVQKRVSNSTTSSKTPTQLLAKPYPSSITASTTGRKSTTPTQAKNAVTSQRKATQGRTTQRAEPLRAKHSTDIVEAVNRNAKNVIKKDVRAKPNAVLDTYHNVTVASPPTRRKLSTDMEKTRESLSKVTNSTSSIDQRPGTSTLEPKDVVVLRRDSAKLRIEREIQRVEMLDVQQNALDLKDPVAFEVNFDSKAPKTSERARSRSRVKTENIKANAEEADENYSDDFESYESDFETGSSSPTEATNGSDNDMVESETDESESKKLELSADDAHKDEVSEDDSELTKYPVTVIQTKDSEQKHDSGSYEINSRRKMKPKHVDALQQGNPQYFDSLDTFSTATSGNFDSGVSSYENGRPDSKKLSGDVYYGGYADFNVRPIRNKRGLELMSKIQFDTLTFTLLELKPISYDIFMQTYGKLNTMQSYVQTQENQLSTDCQTDEIELRSMWTQHPPQYDLQTVQKLGASLNGSATLQNCCGEYTDELTYSLMRPTDEYEQSLQALTTFRQNETDRRAHQALKGKRKPIDIERLNTFLLNASLQMSKILSSGNNNSATNLRSLRSTAMEAISKGFVHLGSQFLNALRVVRVFANLKHNLIITVHESIPDVDVYRSDFSNLLMVWTINECNKPLRLLSTWSEVCRAEISNDCADFVVCGLRDGSVAMWDLRETHSFCSKLDGYLTHFAATQSIVPTWGASDSSKRYIDLGAAVDVKSFREPTKAARLSNTINNFKSIQFTSLHDSGFLTVWTIVETAVNEYDYRSTNSHKSKMLKTPPLDNTIFEYSSPWARMKLIQSAVCDLRNYLESMTPKKPENPFDKTRSYFQNNIYNDSILRELHESHAQTEQRLQGLRFTSIETGYDRIYVCTNRNFVLICSKSLKTERLRKITVDNSRFLFPTALCVLSNEDFLAVGLSNGSVVILNCSQNKPIASAREQQKPESAGALRSAVSPDIVDLETGKSCAIQNIILNERRSFELETPFDLGYDASRPTTAACIAMITNQKKPFELQVYDQQLLMSGSMLRKNLVQSLVLSSDGWRLFVLSNGQLRVYDFYLDQEIGNEMKATGDKKIADIAVAKTNCNDQHLIILNATNDVEVHYLKQ